MAGSPQVTSSLPLRFRMLDDKAWLKLLTQSIRKPRIHDVDFPGFPSPELQAEFVGSANEATLKEAFGFYVLVKQQARAIGAPLRPGSRFLDFGCGWGRFLRFFWKDVDVENLYGCDVNELIVDACRALNVPGQIDLIEPLGSLPYSDEFFDGMMAYSVFTHLPELVHLHWMRELARVARRGSTFCFTVEPRRFIDFIGTVPANSSVDWYRRLSSFKPRIPEFLRSFDSGQLVFMPTNEGVEATYGDAVVPLSFIQEHWSPFFRVVSYIDDPRRFWQAVVVVERV